MSSVAQCSAIPSVCLCLAGGVLTRLTDPGGGVSRSGGQAGPAGSRAAPGHLAGQRQPRPPDGAPAGEIGPCLAPPLVRRAGSDGRCLLSLTGSVYGTSAVHCPAGVASMAEIEGTLSVFQF